jgi:hypothetical protein
MVGVSGCWPFVRFGGSTNVKCKTQAGHWRLNELLYLACVGLAVPPLAYLLPPRGHERPPAGKHGMDGMDILSSRLSSFFLWPSPARMIVTVIDRHDEARMASNDDETHTLV